MTYEEALNEINNGCAECITVNDCIENGCRWYVYKKALKKQTPRKPVRKDTEKPCLYCPNCGAELWIENHHCKCGQKIDWDKEEIIVEDEPKVCSCYREQTAVIYEDEKFKTTIISKCLGTKEQEICSCKGDKNKCNFP